MHSANLAKYSDEYSAIAEISLAESLSL